MARFVKSKFLPNSPCNLMILLRKNRGCGSNLFPDSMGLRLNHFRPYAEGDAFEPLPRLYGIKTLTLLYTVRYKRSNLFPDSMGLRPCFFLIKLFN